MSSFYSVDTSFSPNVLHSRDIFKRCVKCDTTSPSCPSCKEGYTCTMTSQSCDHCATTKCIPMPNSSSGHSGSGGGGGGSNAGAIAGGVIGGVAFVGIVTFLVWWFFVRKKRHEYARQGTGEKRSPYDSRKSTNSIASTVLTRASNVIQIAYIPGVTNRSPPETPSLVPPVPPLPGAAPDQHFFMPGDLRDSTWSDQTSQHHRSIAPSLRSSVATTIYRDNAIVSPMPAQQATLTRAAVVSIHGDKQVQAVQAAPDAPAVPAITPAQLAKAGVTDANGNDNTTATQNNSSIVARGMTAKPVMVKGPGSKKNKNPVQTITEQPESSDQPGSGASSNRSSNQSNQSGHQLLHPTTHAHEEEFPSSGFDASSSDEEDEAPTSRSRSVKSLFKSKSNASNNNNTRTSAFLDTEDSRSSRRSGPPQRVESPFSDANELKEVKLN